MEKFTTITSTYVPLPIENVDTDQIIPARFLKATTREGFGDNLFADWRYDKDGTPKSDFVLNNSTYKGEVLVAGKNFGSGSSREHAAWAIGGYGFRVVVSSFFADIFQNNALNNGILPVVVTDEFLSQLFSSSDKDANATVTVDLEAQTITNNATGESQSFEINPYKKECLLKGLDDIDFLMSNMDKILQFEQQRPFAYK
jgi:3-isopropylmalate/(R)-2-methylmalate dehydratase small subunit